MSESKEHRNNIYRIRAEGVGLVYRSNHRKNGADSGDFRALRNVSLNVKEGEFLSLVGPSGCGKSTFLYILSGLRKLSEGAAWINETPITGPALDRGIIMQAYALFPWRTIRKNVEFGLEVKKLPKKERRATADRFIELVGLSEFADKYPYELSGGMKQRIAIARALAYDPDVLLMDEPFAAVDEQTRGLLHEELLRIWDKTNKTIIFVTHSIDESIFLADRVAVMSPCPGTIKAILDIDLPRPRTPEIKSDPKFGSYRNRVWQLLQNEGERTEEITSADGRKRLGAAPQEAVI